MQCHKSNDKKAYYYTLLFLYFSSLLFYARKPAIKITWNKYISHIQSNSIYKPPSSRTQLEVHSESKLAILFDTQILCNDDSRFFSNSYCSVIGISSYITRGDAAVWTEWVRFLTNFSKRMVKIITGNFQVLHTIYIQTCINNPTAIAWLHRTSSNLEKIDKMSYK